MALKDRVMQDIKTAMKNKDKERLTALRDVKAAILLKETEGGGSEITEQDEIKMIQKLVKQRKESAEVYHQQSRNDLAEKESFEAEVISKYLPEQISEKELNQVLKKIIQDTGAESMKDMGKVIGIANKQLAGRAEGKTIAEMVKKLLA